MRTISPEKTFSFQEKQLLTNGFVLEILNKDLSRFKSKHQYAFIMYVGKGEGYKTEVYDIA
jgi:hypothetical protein